MRKMQEVLKMIRQRFYKITSKSVGTYRVLNDGEKIEIDSSELENVNIGGMFVYFYLKNGLKFKIKRDRYFL